MLLILITCSSLILFCKSLSLKPAPPPSWVYEMTFFLWFLRDLSFSLESILVRVNICSLSSQMSLTKRTYAPKAAESVAETSHDTSILDLPDAVLESILEKLPPNELCRLANVCSAFRDKCSSDHLWQKHMKNEWGRDVGAAACKEWRRQIASRKDSIFAGRFVADFWPLELIRSGLGSVFKGSRFPPSESVMSCYLATVSGRLWFPAQVYNRENGHVGFMLSCYDAMVSYDRRTNTFQARYPEHGSRPITVETGVSPDRLRVKPVDTCSHDLHISSCLDELKAGDHIEIQWRRNTDFPYGWWYGVVGHLETCGGTNLCQCLHSDTLVLEFNQYAQGSRWSRTLVNRKDHKEKGNEVDGFYGGIRKLLGDDEILKWRKLWPTKVFE